MIKTQALARLQEVAEGRVLPYQQLLALCKAAGIKPVKVLKGSNVFAKMYIKLADSKTLQEYLLTQGYVFTNWYKAKFGIRFASASLKGEYSIRAMTGGVSTGNTLMEIGLEDVVRTKARYDKKKELWKIQEKERKAQRIVALERELEDLKKSS